MYCAICKHTIVIGREQVITTTDGATVHLACAEAEAYISWRKRQFYAFFHACVVAEMTVEAFLIELFLFKQLCWFSFAVIAIGSVLHVILHHRWWYYVGQRAYLQLHISK